VSGWLLDTLLFKHLAPGEGGRKPSFREWVSANADSLFLSVISVVEIKASIQKVRATHQEARAAALDAWLEGIVAHYGDRIYPVDAKVAMRAGVLSGPRLADLLLAATAQIHGHGLLTTRIDNFIPLQTGIELKDPFE
jgi:hypothetical protein